MFEVGQYIVKANTGVCKVIDITMYSRSEEDEERECYLLSPYSNESARLFVPVESDKSNMRPIMTQAEALELLKRVPEIHAAVIASEKVREQEYKDAIKSNDPISLVSIIKNLNIRTREREEQGKKSTAVDERYLSLAQAALFPELATALGKGMEEMMSILSEMHEQWYL